MNVHTYVSLPEGRYITRKLPINHGKLGFQVPTLAIKRKGPPPRRIIERVIPTAKHKTKQALLMWITSHVGMFALISHVQISKHI